MGAIVNTMYKPVATQWRILFGFHVSIGCPSVSATQIIPIKPSRHRMLRNVLLYSNFLYICCVFRIMLPDERIPHIQNQICLSSQRSESVPNSDVGSFPQQKGRIIPYINAHESNPRHNGFDDIIVLVFKKHPPFSHYYRITKIKFQQENITFVNLLINHKMIVFSVLYPIDCFWNIWYYEL